MLDDDAYDAFLKRKFDSLPQLQDNFINEKMRDNFIENNLELFTDEYANKSAIRLMEADRELKSCLDDYYNEHPHKLEELIRKAIHMRKVLNEDIPSHFLSYDDYEESILELNEHEERGDRIHACEYLEYVRTIFIREHRAKCCT